MDLLPLSAAATVEQREIRCLRPNVTHEEAVAMLAARGGLLRGQLRSVAAAYLPFRLYQVEVLNRGTSKAALFAADAVSGLLDLYEFAAPPLDADLVRVVTRNCPHHRLDAARALELLENKVRRAVFQTGFFGVRSLQIRARALQMEFHIPYWLGFFGRGEQASLQALDAVRRRLEGAKARAVFSDWLAGPVGSPSD